MTFSRSPRPGAPATTPPCAVDALRLYIPSESLCREFRQLRRIVQERQRFRKSTENYQVYGLPFRLVLPPHGYRRAAPLTLDFMEAGKLSARDMVGAVRRVVSGNPLDVRVGAVDFTADWLGGTVALCRQSLYVRAKRDTTQYVNHNRSDEQYKVVCHCPGKLETLTFGSPKSEDFYRIYDKAAQLRKQGQVNVPAPWVRLERHLSGRCLPERLRTLRGLLTQGATYTPFDRLVVQPRPDVTFEQFLTWTGNGVTHQKRCTAFYTYQLVTHYGEAGARKYLRAANRKPSDDLKLLDRALRELQVPLPAVADFNVLYQTTFRQQLGREFSTPSQPQRNDPYNNTVVWGDSPQIGSELDAEHPGSRTAPWVKGEEESPGQVHAGPERRQDESFPSGKQRTVAWQKQPAA